RGAGARARAPGSDHDGLRARARAVGDRWPARRRRPRARAPPPRHAGSLRHRRRDAASAPGRPRSPRRAARDRAVPGRRCGRRRASGAGPALLHPSRRRRAPRAFARRGLPERRRPRGRGVEPPSRRALPGPVTCDHCWRWRWRQRDRDGRDPAERAQGRGRPPADRLGRPRRPPRRRRGLELGRLRHRCPPRAPGRPQPPQQRCRRGSTHRGLRESRCGRRHHASARGDRRRGAFGCPRGYSGTHERPRRATVTILERYRTLHPKAAKLYDRAREVIPGGITHDIRHLTPFSIYVDRASGVRKWDVDGHEYIDYWMGHGALFLGHCHPAVVKAIQGQVARGTHFGASHEVETRLERGDVAGVILAPAGGQAGTTPTVSGYLHDLRALTRRHGVVLIFDEVITGFRYAPGGAQAYFNVIPDLTTLAKIVAGGLPGGAVCGRRELMSMIAHR